MLVVEVKEDQETNLPRVQPIQPAILLTNKLPYDTTPYSAGYMQPVRSTFASQEPIVNPTMVAQPTVTSTPLIATATASKNNSEYATVKPNKGSEREKRASAAEARSPTGLTEQIKIMRENIQKHPKKYKQTLDDNRIDYIPPPIATKHDIDFNYSNDDIFPVKGHENFEETNPQQQQALYRKTPDSLKNWSSLLDNLKARQLIKKEGKKKDILQL